jgi:hypothetical protein
MVGGAAEMTAGAGLFLAPEPTGLTKVGGVAVIVHGGDNFSAGLMQLLTGKEQETLTSQGLQAAGLSKQNAEIVDGSIGVVGTGVAGGITANSNKVAPIVGKTPSLVEQGASLVKENGGKNRVTLRTVSEKVEVDLAGKAHFDKATGKSIPTPHTKVSPLNPKAPNQPSYNSGKATTEATTQQEIRTVRKYLEKQK